MMKIFISDAVVSKGYDGAPAIRFFNSENGGEFAVFQVGNRKYDSREENNHRWVNLKIKAFGEICERIKKMKLKEGSVVTIFGDYDEERWTDKESKEKRSSPVINLDDIQYSYSGSGQKKGQNGGAQDGTGQGTQQDYPTGQSQPSSYPATGQSQPPAAPPASSGAMPQGFTGCESFSGGNNPYFPG